MKRLSVLLLISTLFIIPIGTGCTKAGSGEDEVVESISKNDTDVASEAKDSAGSSEGKSPEITTSIEGNDSSKDNTAKKDSSVKKDSAVASLDNSKDEAKEDSVATSAEQSADTNTNTNVSENTEKTEDTPSAKSSDNSSNTEKTAKKEKAKKQDTQEEESELIPPNVGGVSLIVSSNEGNITLTQGSDKWTVSYDGGEATPIDVKDEQTIQADNKNVEITYPADGIFYKLEVTSSGKGNIVSNGSLSGNVYLGTSEGDVTFNSKDPLEEYTLFISTDSGSIDVNGEVVEDASENGYNNIGTTDKFVIAHSASGKVQLTFNK